MSFYIKIAGAALLLISAVLLGRAYTAYANRALAEYEGFLSMLAHIKSKISCFLTTQGELLSDFENESLGAVGFLPLIREGESIYKAYSAVESRLAIGKDARVQLSAYLSKFGLGYKDEELSKLALAERELSLIYAREKEEIPKNIKIAKTLLAAAALGVIILII